MREELKKFYLNWVNDYVTLKELASAHNITQKETACLIDLGRQMFIEDQLNRTEL